MPTTTALVHELEQRLDRLGRDGRQLEEEGLPFPTTQIVTAVDERLHSGDLETAGTTLKQGETLLRRVRQDWTWVRELLRRADELRAIASMLGVDVAHLDSRVGNPRDRLRSEPLSSGSLEKAAASASLSLAVLKDAVPKFCVQEAQKLGAAIRRARDRGEDVTDVARSFSRLLQAIQDDNLATAAQRLVEARHLVARIPRAPALPPVSPSKQEEEEILLEARNLAHRLQRIKTRARDAHSAARLLTQVRAALSEDRRTGTPEEEIEALWAEVDRMTKERRRIDELAPAQVPPANPSGAPATDDSAAPADRADLAVPPAEPTTPDDEDDFESARSLYLQYLPPEIPSTPDDPREVGLYPSAKRPRPRSKPPA